MNFSQETKSELAKAPTEIKDCLTLLSAIVHTCGTIEVIGGVFGVKLISETQQLLKLAEKLIESMFGVKTEKLKNGLKASGDAAVNLLTDCKIIGARGNTITEVIGGVDPSLVATPLRKSVYLRGVFLGCGSVSAGKGYHLEMSFASEVLAAAVKDMIERMHLKCGIMKRKEKDVVYLKRGEDICDFFAALGAPKAVLNLNNLIAQNKTRLNINRRSNLEWANQDKTIDVGVAQAEAIKLIDKKMGLDKLDDKLFETSKVRLKNETLSYEELAELLGVSKGSVKYRLKKIMDIAARLQTRL